MKHKSLKDKPSNGIFNNGNAFRQLIKGIAQDEGRKYIAENENLVQQVNPDFILEKNELAKFKMRLAKPTKSKFGKRSNCNNKQNKIVLAILILLILALISIVSFSSSRDWAIDLFMDLNGTYGSVYHTTNGILVKDDNVHAPTVLPAGYNCSSLKMADSISILEYTDVDGNVIIFTQRLDGTPGTIDTEDANVESVMIHGYDGRISRNTDGTSILIWIAKGSIYSLTSNDNRVDLIQIAESVPID